MARKNQRFGYAAVGLGLGVILLLSAPAFAQTEGITIGTGVFPENIASTAGGDLLISSIRQGIVYRVRPGATTAEPWITGIGPAVTGVFAHENNVYLCSNGEFGSNQATLKVYDLTTAQETGSYDFGDRGALCSDIAVAPDGTVYVAQLGSPPGRILRLTDAGLEDVLVDDRIAGVDGLAFLGDTLIANNLRSGELYRINLGEQPVTFTPLTLSQPLEGPDGMRATEDGARLLIAEAQGNRIVSVTVNGDNAEVPSSLPASPEARRASRRSGIPRTWSRGTSAPCGNPPLSPPRTSSLFVRSPCSSRAISNPIAALKSVAVGTRINRCGLRPGC